jgi:hypothetical protein
MSLAGICTALAAVSVTAAGQTPLTYEPNGATRKLKARFETADLPCRVILPFGADFTARASALTIGGTPKSGVWQPIDLLLWESVGQGRGLVDVAPDLLAYIDAYNTAIRAALRLVTSPVAVVESWTFSPDLYTYGELQCWGVEVRLTVKESG